MNYLISIIIPNYNKSDTIGKCLESIYKSSYQKFEVIVVDDCSSDHSRNIIEQYPCHLIGLKEHGGASVSRNAGARQAKGKFLFFTDSDCIFQENTLEITAQSLNTLDNQIVLGGTYALKPFDNNFFSRFQSVFINYSETRNSESPDYIATHALIINKEDFLVNQGFCEEFLPIIEDVEFSHRLKKNGFKLLVNPEIEVNHIFNFNLKKSLKNAFKKSKYWVIYSIFSKGLLIDSGTASWELKLNVISLCVVIILLGLVFWQNEIWLIVLLLIIPGINLMINRKLLGSFLKEKDYIFFIKSVLYYSLIYPFPIVFGTLSGLFAYRKLKKLIKLAP